MRTPPSERRPPSITTDILALRNGQRPSWPGLRLSAHFFDRLVAELERRIRLPASASHEDAANHALDVVLQGICSGKFPGVDDREGFADLLSAVAMRRALQLLRNERRLRRGGGKVAAFSDGVAESGDPSPAQVVESRELDPCLLASSAEEVDRLLGILPSDQRQVAELLRDGFTVQETAKALSASAQAVYRKRAAIRHRWLAEVRDE